MKKLIFLILSFISLAVISCEDNDKIIPPPDPGPISVLPDLPPDGPTGPKPGDPDYPKLPIV